MSETMVVTVTIPNQLEISLREESNRLGISRSRLMCNVMLEWQRAHLNAIIPNTTPNQCKYNKDCYCLVNHIKCIAPEPDAGLCDDYVKQEG